MKYDLAIVTVKNPFIFNEKVQPIKLDIGSNRVDKLTGFIYLNHYFSTHVCLSIIPSLATIIFAFKSPWDHSF